jgi:hypothetical protein
MHGTGEYAPRAGRAGRDDVRRDDVGRGRDRCPARLLDSLGGARECWVDRFGGHGVGRREFADLRVTVSQTRNLINQVVTVSWTGGQPTQPFTGQFGINYLQCQ